MMKTDTEAFYVQCFITIHDKGILNIKQPELVILNTYKLLYC